MRYHRFIIGCLALFGATISVTGLRAETANDILSPEEIYRLTKLAAVEVLVDDRLEGTGCFVTPDGYIATAAHILGAPGRRVEVLTSKGGRRDVKVVAVDDGHDIAILKVDGTAEWNHLPITKRKLPPGYKVYQFGTPIFRHHVMQAGFVARDTLTHEYYGNPPHYVRVTHISASLQKGTSGGPWVNTHGELCGVQSGIMIANNSTAGVAFVAPADAVRVLLSRKTHAKTPSIQFAIEETWQQPISFLKKLPPRTEGLVAKIVPKEGAAGRAGLPKDAILFSVDDRKLRLPDEFLNYVRTKSAGDTIRLTYRTLDHAQTKTLNIQLQALEQRWHDYKE